MTAPEQLEPLDKLSIEQREKLVEFITQADAIIGDADFDQANGWEDCELMTWGLRAAMTLGFEGPGLEKFFRCEFGIAEATEGDLRDWLAVIMLMDAERRLRCAAGGRN